MKKLSKKIFAFVLALAVVVSFSMSDAAAITSSAASKSNVTVKYTSKTAKKASISKISVSVDGAKASSKATVYLTGKKSVKVNTAVTVTTKGSTAKVKKIKNYNKVSYSSSKKSVATVDSKGVITAKKAGKATITVTSKANKKVKAKVTLTVKSGVKSMKLSPSSTKKTMAVDEKYTIKATVATYGKTKADVEAKSSNSKVVAVKVGKTSKGVTKVYLTAKKAGTAKVTIGPKYGSGKDKVITVTVKEPIPVPEPQKTEFTKVVFANADLKTVDVKASVSVKVGDTLKDQVAKIAEAVGGSYTVTVEGKTVEVKDGKIVTDLSKVAGTKSKVNVTISSDKTIAETLKMAEAMKELAEDIKLDATVNVTDEGIGAITDITITKTGDVKFTFAKVSYTAFVKDGVLYLEGDQTALAKLVTVVDNEEIIEKLELVYDVR